SDLRGWPIMMQFPRAGRACWTRLLAAMALLFWLGVAGLASAQPDGPPNAADAESVLSDARKQIDQIREKLEDGAGEDTQLVRWRNDVLDIQSRANTLAEALAPQLAAVTARLSELGSPPEGTREAPDVAAQRTQLQQDNRKLDSQAKLARLLAVEAAQTAEQISTLRRTQFQARLGERRDSVIGEPFWRELRSDLPRDWKRLGELTDELRQAVTSPPRSLWLALAVTIGITLLLRAACSRLLLRLTATRVPPGRLRRSFLAISIVILSSATPGVIAALLYVGLTWDA